MLSPETKHRDGVNSFHWRWGTLKSVAAVSVLVLLIVLVTFGAPITLSSPMQFSNAVSSKSARKSSVASTLTGKPDHHRSPSSTVTVISAPRIEFTTKVTVPSKATSTHTQRNAAAKAGTETPSPSAPESASSAFCRDAEKFPTWWRMGDGGQTFHPPESEVAAVVPSLVLDTLRLTVLAAAPSNTSTAESPERGEMEPHEVIIIPSGCKRVDVVVGVAVGYSLATLAPFVTSFVSMRSNCTQLHLFVNEPQQMHLPQGHATGVFLHSAPAAANTSSRSGWQGTYCPTAERGNENSQRRNEALGRADIQRLPMVAGFLQRNDNRIRYALAADTRDVIFMQDPFRNVAELIRGDDKPLSVEYVEPVVFVTAEDVLFGSEPHNVKWVDTLTGNSTASRLIADRVKLQGYLEAPPVLNSGLIGGTPVALSRVLFSMRCLLDAAPQTTVHGLDQGALNLLFFFGPALLPPGAGDSQPNGNNDKQRLPPWIVIPGANGPYRHAYEDPANAVVRTVEATSAQRCRQGFFEEDGQRGGKPLALHTNCKDQVYSIAHQLDRHPMLWFDAAAPHALHRCERLGERGLESVRYRPLAIRILGWNDTSAPLLKVPEPLMKRLSSTLLNSSPPSASPSSPPAGLVVDCPAGIDALIYSADQPASAPGPTAFAECFANFSTGPEARCEVLVVVHSGGEPATRQSSAKSNVAFLSKKLIGVFSGVHSFFSSVRAAVSLLRARNDPEAVHLEGQLKARSQLEALPAGPLRRVVIVHDRTSSPVFQRSPMRHHVWSRINVTESSSSSIIDNSSSSLSFAAVVREECLMDPQKSGESPCGDATWRSVSTLWQSMFLDEKKNDTKQPTTSILRNWRSTAKGTQFNTTSLLPPVISRDFLLGSATGVIDLLDLAIATAQTAPVAAVRQAGPSGILSFVVHVVFPIIVENQQQRGGFPLSLWVLDEMNGPFRPLFRRLPFDGITDVVAGSRLEASPLVLHNCIGEQYAIATQLDVFPGLLQRVRNGNAIRDQVHKNEPHHSDGCKQVADEVVSGTDMQSEYARWGQSGDPHRATDGEGKAFSWRSAAYRVATEEDKQLVNTTGSPVTALDSVMIAAGSRATPCQTLLCVALLLLRAASHTPLLAGVAVIGTGTGHVVTVKLTTWGSRVLTRLDDDVEMQAAWLQPMWEAAEISRSPRIWHLTANPFDPCSLASLYPASQTAASVRELAAKLPQFTSLLAPTVLKSAAELCPLTSIHPIPSPTVLLGNTDDDIVTPRAAAAAAMDTESPIVYFRGPPVGWHPAYSPLNSSNFAASDRGRVVEVMKRMAAKHKAAKFANGEQPPQGAPVPTAPPSAVFAVADLMGSPQGELFVAELPEASYFVSSLKGSASIRNPAGGGGEHKAFVGVDVDGIGNGNDALLRLLRGGIPTVRIKSLIGSIHWYDDILAQENHNGSVAAVVENIDDFEGVAVDIARNSSRRASMAMAAAQFGAKYLSNAAALRHFRSLLEADSDVTRVAHVPTTLPTQGISAAHQQNMISQVLLSLTGAFPTPALRAVGGGYGTASDRWLRKVIRRMLGYGGMPDPLEGLDIAAKLAELPVESADVASCGHNMLQCTLRLAEVLGAWPGGWGASRVVVTVSLATDKRLGECAVLNVRTTETVAFGREDDPNTPFNLVREACRRLTRPTFLVVPFHDNDPVFIDFRESANEGSSPAGAARKAYFRNSVYPHIPMAFWLAYSPAVNTTTGQLPLPRMLPIPHLEHVMSRTTTNQSEEVQPSSNTVPRRVFWRGQTSFAACASCNSTKLHPQHECFVEEHFLSRTDRGRALRELRKHFKTITNSSGNGSIGESPPSSDEPSVDVAFNKLAFGAELTQTWVADSVEGPEAWERGGALWLDIDGLSSSWEGLRWKLAAGRSPIVKIRSQFGFVQWYYPQLRDGEHLFVVDITATGLACDDGIDDDSASLASTTNTSSLPDPPQHLTAFVRWALGGNHSNHRAYLASVASRAKSFTEKQLRPEDARRYLMRSIARCWESVDEVQLRDWRISSSKR